MKGNNLDNTYTNLLHKILTKGVIKKDRTGTGTIATFGNLIEHNMNEGFPLLTIKKMFTKGVIEELLWFLRGETNIKPLVLKGVNIWNGDAYKHYTSFDYFTELPNKWTFQKAGHELCDPKDDRSWNRHFTQEEFIENIKTDDEFAEKWGDLGPIYGYQWRKWHKPIWTFKSDGTVTSCIFDHIDQISQAITTLKTNPDSRRIMVNSWNVAEIDDAVLPPCHYGFQFWTRELTPEERTQWLWNNCYETGMEWDIILNQFNDDPQQDYKLYDIEVPKRAISLMWEQRSVDTFLGLPFNIASYGFLLHVIGKIVNMIPEDLKASLKDTHLYTNHITQAKEVIYRENKFKLPLLKLNGEFDNINNYWKNDIFAIDDFIKNISFSDFEIINYNSHATLKAELSN